MFKYNRLLKKVQPWGAKAHSHLILLLEQILNSYFKQRIKKQVVIDSKKFQRIEVV